LPAARIRATGDKRRAGVGALNLAFIIGWLFCGPGGREKIVPDHELEDFKTKIDLRQYCLFRNENAMIRYSFKA
jgi:hypothetical protein